MVAAVADSASFVSASWLRQWLQWDLEGSGEGARWDSVSASGGLWVVRLMLPPFRFRKAAGESLLRPHSHVNCLPRSVQGMAATLSLLSAALL